jgi:hypothetical protein
MEGARRTVDRSHALSAARAALGAEDRLIAICAWCGRYGLAGQWLSRDETPRFVPAAHERFTHTACPACLGRLLGDTGHEADGASPAGER